MRAKRKNDMTPDVHAFPGSTDSTFDLVNRYGTYNIQPTADTENVFPMIAPGLPRGWSKLHLEGME